ncbi:hypothetical protein ACVRWQ_07000 [Streptococcus phocae subsp. salmonis]
MKRKIMMLVLVLGAISFFIATTKPVGAIVSGQYKDLFPIFSDEDFRGIRLGKYGIYVEEEANRISDLLQLGFYLVQKEEYFSLEYSSCIEELKKNLIKYDNFLRNNYTNGKLDNLDIGISSKIKKDLNKSLEDFTSAVVQIQKKHDYLKPIVLFADFTLPENFSRFAESKTGESLYMIFFDNYYLKQDITVNQNQVDNYVIKLNRLFSYYQEINNLMNLHREEFPQEVEELNIELSIIMNTEKSAKKMLNYFGKDESVESIVLAEDLPNVKMVVERTLNLKNLLYNFYNDTNLLSGEKLEHYKTISDRVIFNKQELEMKNREFDLTQNKIFEKSETIENEFESKNYDLNTINILNEDTKRNIHFWINDFNTEVNKLEVLKKDGKIAKDVDFVDSLMLRGNQIRQELDEILSNDQDIRGLSEKINALEIISNNLTRVVSNHHIRSSE